MTRKTGDCRQAIVAPAIDALCERLSNLNQRYFGLECLNSGRRYYTNWPLDWIIVDSSELASGIGLLLIIIIITLVESRSQSVRSESGLIGAIERSHNSKAEINPKMAFDTHFNDKTGLTNYIL